jgi:hypothetical protein
MKEEVCWIINNPYFSLNKQEAVHGVLTESPLRLLVFGLDTFADLFRFGRNIPKLI